MTGIITVENIIVIGASAGGLDPLQGLIKALPGQLDSTSIIIAQHTSPNYESMLADLLRKSTKLALEKAKSDTVLKTNTIYICPPDMDVRLLNGKFHFSEPGNGVGPKPSVDKLFESAALAYKEKCIGVILSGTGHDGTNGIAAIKRNGGLVIVQDPDTAGYSGMPDSAILSNMVDLVLDPASIGNELPKLLDPAYRAEMARSNPPDEEEEHIKEVLSLLHQKTGTDFSGYKASTINRRLDKRLYDKKYASLEKYLQEVKDNPEELDQLFQYMLIGVTHFFRNPDSVEVLRTALKQSLAEHTPGSNFRVWIPGCASGEEAYTIAMLLDDLISKGSPQPDQIQIFATDIDQMPLTKARIGRYSANSLEFTPKYFKEKYFTESDGQFLIDPAIKKNILFSKHDITSHPPFLRLNLVSCRNLLIYFKPTLQNQIIPLFHYTLEQEGLLYLGKSETIGRFKNLFETVDSRHKIYRKRLTDSNVSNIPILKPLVRPTKQYKSTKNLLNEPMTISSMVKETFYNSYEHPYIVIDDGLNILEINKDVSFFLSLQHGTPNLNAIKLIHPDLKLDLRTLTGLAYNSLTSVTGNYRKIVRDNEKKIVRLKIQPTLYSKPKSPYFIVSFDIAGENDALSSSVLLEQEKSPTENPIIAELEHELAATKEHINTLVEELETSNEELQSLNEELQSSNEELQASNEELETSNEELQATNEELNVAYNEIRETSSKLEEKSLTLNVSQSNLKSVLENTQQAFVLIDSNYKILLFNNYAFKLYIELFGIKLEEGNVYIDLLPGDSLQAFQKSFKDALNGKQGTVEEVLNDGKNRQRYLAFNYTPIESSSTRSIRTVSLSCIDITDKRHYEIALEKAYDQSASESQLWRSVFEDSPDSIAIFSGEEYTISYANKAFKDIFPKRELQDQKLLQTIPEIETQGFLSIIDKVRESGKTISKKEAPVRIIQDQGEPTTKYFNLTFRSVQERNEELSSVAIHAIDITQQVQRRVKIEEQQQFMVLIAETVPEHIWVLLPDQKIEFINEPGLQFFDWQEPRSLKDIIEKVHPKEKDSFKNTIHHTIKKAENFDMELRFQDKNGSYVWHILKVRPMVDSHGHLLRIVASAADINDQKASQQRKDEFMGVASHELKTPLTSVKAYTQLLQSHLKSTNDETAHTYLERTHKGIEKLEKFVSDLLDISRIQSGRLTLEKSKVSITNLVKNVVDNLRLISRNYNISLEIPEEPIEINIDPARIEQVIINLINNAIKYSATGKDIHVLLTKESQEVVISVEDQGVGISKDNIDNIFDRFYRVAEHQHRVSGMGIGLNISKEILNLHGGRIWVESEVNKGSTFYFSIPLDGE